jgi:hypothetical protein
MEFNQNIETKQVGGMLRRFSALLERSAFAAKIGQSFGGKRNLYDACGYDSVINAAQIWDMYNRGGIAKRVIHAFPDSTWARPPQLYMKGNDAWNTAFDKFAIETGLWSAIHRADVLAALGRYAIILIGTDKGALEMPLKGAKKVTFFQPYAESNARISKWVTDPTSDRFGQPEEYMIYPQSAQRVASGGSTQSGGQLGDSVMPVAAMFRVHASRIIHVAQGGLQSKVYGIPAYFPIWNYLTDLQKVVGASSESYWRSAYQGMHANVDKDLDLSADDEANLSEELDEYQHDLRRIIRTRGVSVQSIGSTVANPKGAFDVILTLISGTTGIPARILVGNEAGQLASSQDKGFWAERIEENRELHCIPNIILPMMRWLDASGIMKMDVTAVSLLWPEAYRMSPLERGQQSAQTARTVANLAKALEDPMAGKFITSTTSDPSGTLADSVAVNVTSDTSGNKKQAGGSAQNGDLGSGKQPSPDNAPSGNAPAKTTTTQVPAVDAPFVPLLSYDEARKIIGLSTDDKALLETPE